MHALTPPVRLGVHVLWFVFAFFFGVLGFGRYERHWSTPSVVTSIVSTGPHTVACLVNDAVVMVLDLDTGTCWCVAQLVSRVAVLWIRHACSSVAVCWRGVRIHTTNLCSFGLWHVGVTRRRCMSPQVRRRCRPKHLHAVQHDSVAWSHTVRASHAEWWRGFVGLDEWRNAANTGGQHRLTFHHTLLLWRLRLVETKALCWFFGGVGGMGSVGLSQWGVDEWDGRSVAY